MNKNELMKEITKIAKSSKNAAEAVTRLEAFFKENDILYSFGDVAALRNDQEFNEWVRTLDEDEEGEGEEDEHDHQHMIEVDCQAYAVVKQFQLNLREVSDCIIRMARVAEIIENKTSGSFTETCHDGEDTAYEIEVRVTKKKRKKQNTTFFYNPNSPVKL